MIEHKDICSVGEGAIGTFKLLLGGYNDTIPLEAIRQYIAILLKSVLFVDSAILLLRVCTKVLMSKRARDFCMNLVSGIIYTHGKLKKAETCRKRRDYILAHP